ncbi:hypothetical protein P280DRAFT_518339 [Massarina eburnea CBS 473.64]|uniref:ABC transporter domain-containing protein n=1 Tax=Massarina eburnea CBS 473.64 TaxID=1395130 RepID=A0A6A6S108_9PLEO|nr:hypothetical protein P280DRAFT_518339 [Massarina eburnea CBS 473.64]
MAASNFTCLTGDNPVSLTDDYQCNTGFFCPNNDKNHPPQYCPPTKQCQATRLLMVKNICTEPQGFYEPSICAPGFYCPPHTTKQLECPSGHYCPTGSEQPLRCNGISACPVGSSGQRQITGLVALLLVDIGLLYFLMHPYIRSLVHRLQKGTAQTSTNNSDTASVQRTGKEKAVEDSDQALSNLEDFVNSSKRGIGLDATRMQIEFDQLGLTLDGSQKEVLKGVTGHAGPGSLLAVMGASGAATFVRVLMGKAKATSGTTSINGTPRNMSDFKKIIGYVPQDDIVLPELTVRENLLHSARVRLPKTWKSGEIGKHVDTLILCLHLSNVQDSLVGDVIKPVISGGQRKRVSIGIELAAAPMVLILDEPTSGLDATSALSIIELLKSLSSLGVTVICIIHQPRHEIFLSLDRVLLLAGGRQIFLGNTKDSANYFRGLGYSIPKECNPADAIIDIISGESQRYMSSAPEYTPRSIEDLAEIWSRREDANNPPTGTDSNQDTDRSVDLEALARSASERGASRLYQVYYCFMRSLTQQTRQIVGFVLEIIVGAIAGLLIGLSVYQLDGFMFQGIYRPPFELLSSSTNYTLVPELGLLNSLAIGLAAAAPGVKTFGEEKTMYWREAASGHSRSAYFVGKILSTFFRIGLSALHFTVFYALLATPIMPFGQLYLAHLLYFYCIYGLACAVSMVVSRQDGPLLAIIGSLIIGIFGGYGPSLSTVKTWHLEWAWRMCPGTWFSEAYFHAHTTPFAYLWDIEAAAKWTGYTLNQLSLDMGMLFIIGTVYRVLAYIGLVFLNRDKQI